MNALAIHISHSIATAAAYSHHLDDRVLVIALFDPGEVKVKPSVLGSCHIVVAHYLVC